jgi:hypothetical protein
MQLRQVLISLPSGLVGSTVLSCHSLWDIVQLDAASAEKGFRRELFRIYLATSAPDLQSFLPGGVNEEVLRWFFRRRVLVGDMVIHGAELATSQVLADNADAFAVN